MELRAFPVFKSIVKNGPADPHKPDFSVSLTRAQSEKPKWGQKPRTRGNRNKRSDDVRRESFNKKKPHQLREAPDCVGREALVSIREEDLQEQGTS